MKTENFSIEEIYEVAKKVVPLVMHKLEFSPIFFDGDDVVNEYIVKMMDHDYINNIDLKKGNIKSYIFEGLKNVAINISRKFKSETSRLDFMVLDEGAYNRGTVNGSHLRSESLGDRSSSIDSLESDLLIEKVLDNIKDKRFGNGKSAIVNGEKYEPTLHSVIRLIALGFNRENVASIFGIHSFTIIQEFRKLPKKELVIRMLKG